jgi:hypothetical protein
MGKVFFVSDVARQLNCTPRDITLLLYDRVIPDEATSLVGGRRLIPEESIPLIEQAIRDRQQRREQRAEAGTVAS